MPPVVSRRVAVPPGWRREVKEGRVHYFSPDCRCMLSAEDVVRHLLSAGTCKCGLPCPFHLENIFNFDPHLESSHNDNSFALHSSPLPVPGRKHCCRVVPRVDDEMSRRPHADTMRNQPCGTDGVIAAETFPPFRPDDSSATTLPLPALSGHVEAAGTPRSEFNPSEQSTFQSIFAGRDTWQGPPGDLMQQAPPIAQHTSHIVQQLPSNLQQPQRWGTPAHHVAAPCLPPPLYEAPTPPPPTYPRPHHQYGMSYNSPIQPAAYPTDLNPLPVEAPFGARYCGDSQSSSCGVSFSPLSTPHGTSMVLPPHYPTTQSHQSYPSDVYPSTDPWAARNQDPPPQSWPHMGVPLKDVANECATMFHGSPAQRAPLYTPQQQGNTPEVTPMAAMQAQHGILTPSLLPEDANRTSVKVEDPSPQVAVEATKETVMPKSEVDLGNNAQFEPLHNSPQGTLSSKPLVSQEPPSRFRPRSSLSSCSSSSSSDSSSSVSSSSGGEETAKGTSSGSQKTVCPPLVVSYRREKVDCWLKKKEESHELLSMAVRIPLSALPGSAGFKPVSPGTPSKPRPLNSEPHPHGCMSFESGGDFSEELWVKIKLGMTQTQPEVRCDRQVGESGNSQAIDAKLQSLPLAAHIPPSKGKRLARRSNTREKEGGSASPDSGFSPLELARMDRTLLGLRPRGKALSSQQPSEKGDTPTVDLSRKTRQQSLRESPTRGSPLPPCKKRITEDFEAYLPKGVDVGDLSHMSFADGSLVWAKGKGLPFWPGMVCAAKELAQKSSAPGKHWVRWFGDSTFSETEESNMKPLAEGMTHYINALERKKGIKDRQRLIVAFKEAFKAITNDSREEEFTVEEESIHSGEEALWQ